MTRVSTASSPRTKNHRPVLWLLTAAVLCLLASNVRSQIPEPDVRFSIDLGEVGKAYDRMNLFPATAWDTIRPFDFSTFRFGPRNRVPHFLKSDFKRTKTDVKYDVLANARFTYTYPASYRFDIREVTSGEFYTYEPRDVSIPGLKIEIATMDEVVEQVREQSFHEAWREGVVSSVMSQQRGTGERRAGLISVDIPLPMPSQLESIFGPGENTHIDISGREEITFAGESRKVEPFIGVEGQQKQSLFPQLDMEQKLSVTLSGTIGDKVFVQVDHSSEQTLGNNNNVQLWYEGYDDDVIKRVDLGNTNLSLSGSNLISFSSASTGLFGVKVLAEVGSTEMTVIASKQEGETSGASFSPTSGGLGQTESRVIHDIDYIRNKYFWLNDPDYGGLPADPTSEVRDNKGNPINLEVWLEINPADKLAQPDLDWMPGKAFYDADGYGSTINAAAAEILAKDSLSVPFVQQDFKLLEYGVDYDYVQDIDAEAGVVEAWGIVLRQPVPEDKALAVSYITTEDAGDANSPYIVGGPYSRYGIPLGGGGGERDTMLLELIKAKNPKPDNEFGDVWRFMMRNFYNLGLTFIDPASFDLTIRDNTPRLDTSAPTGSTVPYIRIFGLDQKDVAGNPRPDGRIDAPSVYLNTETGILQFPSRWGFAPPKDTVTKWTNGEFSFDSLAYQEQYDKSVDMYTTYSTIPFVDFYQYDIVVEAVSTTKTFRIDALNIIENSEQVTIDGTSLTRGSDYDINYDTGEVELKGNALDLLGPDSKVNIDYEYTPFGGGASSSLVGFSTTSKFSENARLGTIFLYESKGTSMEKPRLGEEPTRAIVGGINGQFQHTSRFLTGLANLLPMVDTDARSVINVNGEIAASIPDPNTKGEAYIEDFEGIEDSDRISTSRRGWYTASLPVDPLDSDRILPVATRADIFWYNIEPSYGLHKRDLNPDLNERENNLVSTLDIEIAARPEGSAEPVWAGVMTGFGAGGLDLSRGQFLEIWVNDFKPEQSQRGGRLRIDLGRIDENFYEPSVDHWNDEDRDRDGFNACIDDTGLDEMHNFLPDCVSNFYPDDPTEGGLDENDDRAGDDYLPQRIDGRFSKVNGTEKNGILDTEDLDRSGQMDRTNSYMSLVIDLADSAVVDIRREFPDYEGFDEDQHTRDAWRLYRVKLTEAQIVSPSGSIPRLDEVRHVRVWIDDVDSVFHFDDADGRGRFQFAELKVVGNRWERDGVRDLDDALLPDSVYSATEFQIGAISTKTDPTRYNPPIVPREENGVFDKEQSMFVKFDSLEPGRSIRIFKQFVGKGLDLTSYRDLNFWVHADPEYLDTADSSLVYYMRLAFDENNFYEIRFPVIKNNFDPVTGWADIRVRLEDLTGLKLAQTESEFEVSSTIRDIVQTSRRYNVRLVNKPNLFDIRYLYAGLRNESETVVFVTGDIWMNDIYAGAVRRDIGVAQRLGANVNIGGGVLSIGGTWQRTDADFRGLRARRGSGVVNEGLSLNAKTRVEHFIPLLGFSIPLSGTYSKTTTLPRYTPNGDTEITSDAVRDSMRSETITRTFSTSLVKKGSKNPLLKYTVDKTTTSFSFSEQMRRSPTARDTSRTMTGSLVYQINSSKQRAIPLWRGIKLGYWPKSVNFRVQATRKTARRNRLRSGTFVPDPFYYDAKVNLNGSLSYSPLKSLTASLNGAMARDLNTPHYRYGVDIGRETSRNHALQLSWKPPRMFLISEFQPDLSFNSSYREQSGPEVRRPGDPSGTRNSANQRTVTGKMLLDAGKYFGKVFGFFGLVEQNAGNKNPAKAGQPPVTVPDTTGAAGDTTAAEPSRPRADPMIAVRKFGDVLSNIRKININVQQKFNSRYSRIPARPSLAYQFGLTESSGIIKSQETLDQPDQSTDGLSIIMDSGVQVTQDLDVAARFNTSLTTTSTKGAEAETQTMTWPDISLKWTGLERFALFRPVFATSSANLLYRKSTRETGRKGEVDSKTESLTLSPSMAFTFKNEITSTLAITYNSDLTDNRGNITDKNSLTVSLDLKKDFRGGSGFKLPIPFFSKQIKWSSTLNSNVNIAYSRSGGKRYQEGSELTQPIPSATSIKISPNLTYSFSRALNGRFFVDYTRAYAEASDQTTTTLRVGLSAVLTF